MAASAWCRTRSATRCSQSLVTIRGGEELVDLDKQVPKVDPPKRRNELRTASAGGGDKPQQPPGRSEVTSFDSLTTKTPTENDRAPVFVLQLDRAIRLGGHAMPRKAIFSIAALCFLARPLQPKLLMPRRATLPSSSSNSAVRNSPNAKPRRRLWMRSATRPSRICNPHAIPATLRSAGEPTDLLHIGHRALVSADSQANDRLARLRQHAA